jgi:hypothetical protein
MITGILYEAQAKGRNAANGLSAIIPWPAGPVAVGGRTMTGRLPSRQAFH